MRDKEKAPVEATIQAGHKDKVFDAESQPIPCIGCLKWHWCGAFTWIECNRMGRFLRIRKEAATL